MIVINAIFLSRTTTDDIYEMTCACINSFIDAERENQFIHINCILIESNKEYEIHGFKYPDNITVITPDETFNFHRFLNIGIKYAKADYYALCNNDVLFENNFLSEIIKVSEETGANSLSPFDYSTSIIPFKILDNKQDYILSYDVMGWCIVFNQYLLDIIGELDETFDFYYADDDYTLNLRYFNQQHALVLTSKARHLDGMVTKSSSATVKRFMRGADKTKNKSGTLPWYLKLDRYQWIVENKKMLDGHMKLYNKWGDYEVLRVKKFIHNKIMKYGGNKFLSKLLFSHHILDKNI